MQASISLPATIIRSAISSTMTTMNGIGCGWKLSVSKTGSPVSSSKPVCTVRVKRLVLGERVLHPGVVAVDVAHAHLRHLAVALAPSRATTHFSATTAFFGSVTTGERRCGMPS